MTRSFELLLILSLAACTSPPSRPLDAATVADIRAIAREALDDGVVGLAVGVVRDGELVFAEGFGHVDAARTRRTSVDTSFDVASVGKHVTAAAILHLEERGALELSQHVREFVPELPVHFPDATIEQLLRHTSGFVAGDLDEQRPPTDYATRRYGLALLTDVELQTGRATFAPGETWVYCNPGYLVLGLVVEAASGMRYDEYVRDELLAPHGLDGLTVCERAEPGRMSEALHRHADGSVAPVAFIDMTAYAGQGSVCASVVDLLAWWHALNDGRVVDGESLAAMRRPSTVHGDHAAAIVPYGMAQRLGEIGAHRKVGHTGTFDGGSASLTLYPDDDLEIAVLSNTRGAGTPHANRVETAIAKRLLGHVDPDVASLARPVTDAQRRAIEGRYTRGREFVATIEGDELVVVNGGREIERLVHLGAMRFRRVDQPDVFEWFVMDGERAGWWVYSASGNFIEVLRRVD